MSNEISNILTYEIISWYFLCIFLNFRGKKRHLNWYLAFAKESSKRRWFLRERRVEYSHGDDSEKDNWVARFHRLGIQCLYKDLIKFGSCFPVHFSLRLLTQTYFIQFEESDFSDSNYDFFCGIYTIKSW